MLINIQPQIHNLNIKKIVSQCIGSNGWNCQAVHDTFVPEPAAEILGLLGHPGLDHDDDVHRPGLQTDKTGGQNTPARA